MKNSDEYETPRPIIPPSSHSHLFPLIFTGLAMLMMGLAGGYFLFLPQKDTVVTNKMTTISPTKESEESKLISTDTFLDSIVFLQNTSLTIGQEGSKVFLTQDTSGEKLYLAQKNVPLNKSKLIYKFDYPSAQGFTTPIFIVDDYIIATIAGGGGTDILLFNPEGEQIINSLYNNQELKHWYIGYSGKKTAKNTIEIDLAKVDGSQATAQIDISTGKMIPGSLIKKAK